MVDWIAIVSTCAACLYVAWRALILDGQIPWFGEAPESPDKTPPRPTQRTVRTRR